VAHRRLGEGAEPDARPVPAAPRRSGWAALGGPDGGDHGGCGSVWGMERSFRHAIGLAPIDELNDLRTT
jgi:hypothetical protein